MAPAPIQFDRASGALEGANPRERTAAPTLAAGSKTSSHLSHRGFIGRGPLSRTMLAAGNIAVKLMADANFDFLDGEGSWGKPLNRSYHHEEDLAILFCNSADVDYTQIDCGTERGSDHRHAPCRAFQMPLKFVAYDPRSNRPETVTELSTLDRTRVCIRVGYNIFGRERALAKPDRCAERGCRASHPMKV